MTRRSASGRSASSSFATAATVIQLHVLGMFLPSFFTGSLIARFGVLRIMLTGVVILAGHVLMTLTGTGFRSFAGALVLLGIGWSVLQGMFREPQPGDIVCELYDPRVGDCVVESVVDGE